MNGKPFFQTLSICLLFLAPLPGHAQTEELSGDLSFFQQQEKTYQRWLDQSGLGKVLRVQGSQVDQNTLSLYLGFRYQDLDSIQAGWESLEAAFTAAGPVSLEQELFGKMLHFMQVPQGQALVQVYDTYDVTKAPLFFRGIYFRDGAVKVEKSDAKAERKLAFRPASLAGMKKMSVATFKAKYDKATVFRSILGYLKKRYEEDPCANREPRLEVLEEDHLLRFVVTDLCREVLTNSANPTLCAIVDQLGYPCNWVRREKLDFTITYVPQAEGFNLEIRVDGSYGSGRFKEVPRGGYFSMEAEPALKPYLELYANKLKTTLSRVILYGQP